MVLDAAGHVVISAGVFGQMNKAMSNPLNRSVISLVCSPDSLHELAMCREISKAPPNMAKRSMIRRAKNGQKRIGIADGLIGRHKPCETGPIRPRSR